MRQKVLDLLTSQGKLVHPDVVDHILNKENPLDYVSRLVKNVDKEVIFITLEHMLKCESEDRIEDKTGEKKIIPFEEHQIKISADEKKEVVQSAQILEKKYDTDREIKVHIIRKNKESPAKEYAGQVKVLKDVTGQSTCEGCVKDFVHYFNDRFRALKRMLRMRKDMGGAHTILEAKRSAGDIKFIGIVNEVSITKNGHKLLRLEDDEGYEIPVILPAKSQIFSDPTIPDEVIGVVGILSKNREIIIGQEIVRPDISLTREPNKSEIPISVAFLSDIHVGSSTFLKDRWDKFINFLKSNERGAERIKYVVITGDVVDGIGVYPDQEKDLAIDDIYRQYEALSSLMIEIPDHIVVIMCPGNHDAVRPSEPQPTFPIEIRKLFNREILFVGNPSLLSIEGVLTLIYHGRSMDDFISKVPDLDYTKPISAMKEMLKRRHLAPIYGEKTPIAPENSDYLVIDKVPDIFVTGHVHSIGMEYYRGVTLINASAWQSQTAYQLLRNFSPMPAKVPIVDLNTGKGRIMDFN